MSLFSLITGSFKNFSEAKGVFTETARYEKGFAQYYIKNIKPSVASFEKKRVESLKKASFRIRISIAIAFVMLIIKSSINYDQYNNVVNGIMLLILFGLGGWTYFSIHIYKSSIKSDIFPKILSFIGNYKYSPQCNNMVPPLKDSGIIPNYDRERSEDSISGVYKGVKIDLFETNLIERQRRTARNMHSGRKYSNKTLTNFAINLAINSATGGNNGGSHSSGHRHHGSRKRSNDYHDVTVFKGIIINLSINKSFNGKTIVKKDSGKIGNFFKNKFSKLENVQLEDPQFEKMFEVYSDDQVEARYLLTTSFMDRLLRLAQSFGSKDIQCSFHDNKLLMMIPVEKNLFEPGSIYEAEDFVDDSKSLLREMVQIFQIINILKLDKNIGM